jgi:hypothetical protein
MEMPRLPRFRRSPKLHSVTLLAQQPPPLVRRPSRSLIAWVALVLLIGVGHVVPALHFLFVAHHLCAEHGELVDGRSESSETARAKADSSARAASAEKAADSAAARVFGAASHSHEHCEVFSATRGAPALVPAPAPAELLAAVQPCSSEAEEREAHVDIGLLHYAPKLAPPALAVLA